MARGELQYFRGVNGEGGEDMEFGCKFEKPSLQGFSIFLIADSSNRLS